LVDSSKMQEILSKAARNRHNECELFQVSLHLNEELQSIKTDFGPKLDNQLKELITEFATATQELQGLPPHQGILDHKIRLTSYPIRQRRNRLSVPEFQKLKRQCIDIFKQGLVRVSNSPSAALIVMVRKSGGSIRVCVDYRALNECTVKDSFPLPRIDDLSEHHQSEHHQHRHCCSLYLQHQHQNYKSSTSEICTMYSSNTKLQGTSSTHVPEIRKHNYINNMKNFQHLFATGMTPS